MRKKTYSKNVGVLLCKGHSGVHQPQRVAPNLVTARFQESSRNN